MKKSLMYSGCVLIPVLILSVPVLFILVIGTGWKRTPYTLGDELPDKVTVLEEFSVTSSIYLAKCRFESEDDIDKICATFHLLPNQDDVSYSGGAQFWDERSDIPWFPLKNANRRLAYRSLNADRTLKDDATGGYESILWIDDENKLLILQLQIL